MSGEQPQLNGSHRLAVNKPPNVSSAQVLRDLQAQFNPSKFFAPWLQGERDRLEADQNNRFNSRNRWKKKRPLQVKLGHGGTLDPAATGVLIVGIGSGTKELANFLDCTKSYEAVVLFGAATDSYDGEGKIVGRKPFTHITREGFEKALQQFRGKTKQKPPIFSALSMDGKRLYEYAREGKELPRQIEDRAVTIYELELVEWLEPGTHSYKFPEAEAEQEEKVGALKLLSEANAEQLAGDNTIQSDSSAAQTLDQGKRKRASEEAEEDPESLPETKRARAESHSEPTADADVKEDERSEETEDRPPAARIRMTVSGGFYVRSLCHDLGLALKSFALMANLMRTRQGEFKLGDDLLDYHDLNQGEQVWDLKVARMLERWRERRSG